MSLITDGVEIGSARRMRLTDRAQLLAGLPLFSGCAKRDLKAVARLTFPVQVESGTALFTEGAPSTEAYVIVAGTVEVRAKGRKMATLGPGDIVGELGLLLDRPRNATVRALTPLDTLAISRRDLRAAVLDAPALGWSLLEAVAHRLSS
jgi:CRP-like cAMP-binding protein